MGCWVGHGRKGRVWVSTGASPPRKPRPPPVKTPLIICDNGLGSTSPTTRLAQRQQPHCLCLRTMLLIEDALPFSAMKDSFKCAASSWRSRLERFPLEGAQQVPSVADGAALLLELERYLKLSRLGDGWVGQRASWRQACAQLATGVRPIGGMRAPS